MPSTPKPPGDGAFLTCGSPVYLIRVGETNSECSENQQDQRQKGRREKAYAPVMPLDSRCAENVVAHQYAQLPVAANSNTEAMKKAFQQEELLL